MTELYVCDHPELLTKDNLCHLCEQLDGQISAFEQLQDKT